MSAPGAEHGACSQCGGLIKWVWVDQTRTVGHYILASSNHADRGDVCKTEYRRVEINGRTTEAQRDLPHALATLPAADASTDDLEAWLDS